ncbi:hypothetical protein [Aquibaculum arenosum]|uniref:Uncharacterized protein n=1 Tax=Aquibaculum arenosum TaxID=3032591 RepID=A0ABT5YLT9_9PROT|nr:hypothetical protein [Fodinicurvata sp. CAU 1616]MDF2095834.1 hypothetical protein [Fodinicurvata sp. CAU 1616]
MKQQILSLAAGLALVLVLPLAEATAQWNNRPYQPAFRGAAGGVGMSPGYRQVIIQDRLSDRMSRNNLYRLPSGALADVAQDRDQAFIIGADGLPSVRTGRVSNLSGFGYGGGGLGYGIGGAMTRPTAGFWVYALRSSATGAFNGWWPLLTARDGSGARGAAGATPIDGWIGQLDSLR